MVFMIIYLANQKALATRQRGALGEIRTTRAQQLRNKMIQKNQEAKIPAKRPLTGIFFIISGGKALHVMAFGFFSTYHKIDFVSVLFLFENWPGTFFEAP